MSIWVQKFPYITIHFMIYLSTVSQLPFSLIDINLSTGSVVAIIVQPRSITAGAQAVADFEAGRSIRWSVGYNSGFDFHLCHPNWNWICKDINFSCNKNTLYGFYQRNSCHDELEERFNWKYPHCESDKGLVAYVTATTYSAITGLINILDTSVWFRTNLLSLFTAIKYHQNIFSRLSSERSEICSKICFKSKYIFKAIIWIEWNIVWNQSTSELFNKQCLFWSNKMYPGAISGDVLQWKFTQLYFFSLYVDIYK